MPPRRILYLSRWWPAPPDNGSRLRAWGQLRALAAAGHRLTLLAFDEAERGAVAATDVSGWCDDIEAIARRPYDPLSWRARMGYLSPTPRSLIDVFSPAMQAAVERAAPAHDLVIACTLDMGSYAPWFSDRPAILDDLELGGPAEALHCGGRRSRLRAALTWSKLTRYVARLLPRFSACTVSSPLEAELAQRAAPGYGAFHVIANAVDAAACAATQAQPVDNRILFSGSLTFAPNREAMRWFIERVLPRVRANIPDAELLISGAPPRDPFPTAAGVRLTGWVDDIRATIAAAAVSIAPIRIGGGTRLKILEAMAVGSPVVATSKAAEGLVVVHGEHLLIADEEEIFAAQVVRLLRDPALRRRLSAAGRVLVARDYDLAVVGQRFCDLVASVAARDTSNGRARE